MICRGYPFHPSIKQLLVLVDYWLITSTIFSIHCRTHYICTVGHWGACLTSGHALTETRDDHCSPECLKNVKQAEDSQLSSVLVCACAYCGIVSAFRSFYASQRAVITRLSWEGLHYPLTSGLMPPAADGRHNLHYRGHFQLLTLTLTHTVSTLAFSVLSLGRNSLTKKNSEPTYRETKIVFSSQTLCEFKATWSLAAPNGMEKITRYTQSDHEPVCK